VFSSDLSIAASHLHAITDNDDGICDVGDRVQV